MPGSDRLAVLTTVFPVVRPFLDDFAGCLTAQSDPGFTLFAVNDGLPADEIRRALEPLDVIVVEAGRTPAENRRLGMRAVLDAGFAKLVFADADDTMRDDRIAASKIGLRSADMVFNDLALDCGRSLLARRFGAGYEFSWRDVLDRNFLGLSNTALRTELLKAQLEFVSADSSVVDWGLFTRLLHAGARLAQVDTQTHYRRHASSFAVLGAESEASVRQAVTVKAHHYAALRELDHRFRVRAGFFAALVETETDSKVFRDYAARCLNESPARPLWWEIARFEEGDKR